mmetsp:Transcript_19163/g.51608  ORF Transcript_19163/g.51608 Transcript_19163/m.51608 type:complete len:883 (+) Transcript_19163:180-2828(+)
MEDPILDDVGDGAFEFNDLPDFANEQNKELHHTLRNLEKEVVALDGELADAVERTKTMREHLANVEKEAVTTQQLVDARVHEIETEDHLKQLAEREKGRFFAELKKHKAEVAELQDKLNIAQNAMFKGNEQMDAFKLKMNWNQEELEQWALAARQKEEDSMALAKYTKADEGKIRELTLQIEKMMAEVQVKRSELEAEVTDTQSQQIVLDKTAEDFRKLHAERQQLVRQWEDAVKNMQRRDKDIEAAGERFQQQKAALREKQALHAEREEELAAQEKGNEELDAQIANDERELEKVRQAQARSTAGFDEITDQIEVMKNTLSKAAAELQNKKDETANMHALLDDKKRALERKKKALIRAEAELESHRTRSLTLEQAAKEVEQMAKDADVRAERAERALQELKEKTYKESEHLFKQRQEETNTLAEINGAQRTSRNASSRIRKLDEQAQRQRELVYNADFKLQLLERRISRMQGERTEAEKRDLTKKIKALTEEVEAATAQHTMLTAQLKRLRNDLNAGKRRNEILGTDVAKLEGEIGELELKNQTSTQALKVLVKDKEDKMVSHDVLKLEVKKLREQLSAVVDETFGLDNRKAQLQLSMEERQREVAVHADVLKAQLKAAEDERHRVAKMLAEREMRIEKLRQKFAIVAGRVLPPDDGSGDSGEQNTQAYYIIRAAQEREELQREGDELDQKIQKTEREIRALEKTLNHLYAKNSAYKQSFSLVDPSTPLYEQKLLLEEQQHAAVSKFRAARLEQSELEEDVNHMRDTELQVNQAIGTAGERIGEYEGQSQQLGAQVVAQELEAQRTQEEMAQTLAELRMASGRPEGAPLPAELHAQVMETSTRAHFMVDSLRNLAEAQESGEFRDATMQLLTERRLISGTG